VADEILKWRGHEIPRVEAGYYELSTPGFFIIAWTAVEGLSHAQLAVNGVPHVSVQANGSLDDALEAAAKQLTEKLDTIDEGRHALLGGTP